METSGHILPQVKAAEAIGFQRGSGRFREEYNFLPVPGFKRRALRPVQQKLWRGKSKFEFCSELLVLSYCPNYKQFFNSFHACFFLFRVHT